MFSLHMIHKKGGRQLLAYPVNLFVVIVPVYKHGEAGRCWQIMLNCLM